MEIQEKVRAREDQVVFVDGIENPRQFTNRQVLSRKSLASLFHAKYGTPYFRVQMAGRC